MGADGKDELLQKTCSSDSNDRFNNTIISNKINKMNKRNKRSLLKIIWLWGPVFLQMGVILYYSSQPSGSESLEMFPLPAGIGHFGGYGLLSLFFYRAMNRGFGWLRWNLRVAVIAVFISSLYGVWDEFYQSFIPGRYSTITDVLIDVSGAVTAMVCLWLILKLSSGLKKL